MISKTEFKYIQSLAHKKFREDESAFVVEGVKWVNEMLSEFPSKLRKIFATKEWLQTQPNLPNDISCVEVSLKELERISFQQQPNKVLAVAELPRLSFPDHSGIVLVLDQIQDPGNLGTIIRTCDWFGVTAIVCSPDCADAFAPKVVQSTMGSIFRLPIRYCELDAYLESIGDIPIYAATLSGMNMQHIDFKKPCCLVIGNESRGISSVVLKRATDAVSIPRHGKAESLNAAVATAILLSRMTS